MYVKSWSKTGLTECLDCRLEVSEKPRPQRGRRIHATLSRCDERRAPARGYESLTCAGCANAVREASVDTRTTCMIVVLIP